MYCQNVSYSYCLLSLWENAFYCFEIIYRVCFYLSVVLLSNFLLYNLLDFRALSTSCVVQKSTIDDIVQHDGSVLQNKHVTSVETVRVNEPVSLTLCFYLVVSLYITIFSILSVWIYLTVGEIITCLYPSFKKVCVVLVV